MSLLERGQKIGLVATANPVTPELHNSLEYAIGFFKKIGLKPVIGRHALDQAPSGKLIVNAETRAADVNDFARDPEVKAIVNLWGGYDSADLLPHLDWTRLKDKFLIGASDFTTLLNVSHEKEGIITYLWANAIWLGLEQYRRSESSFESFFMKDSQDKNNLFLLDEPEVLKPGQGVGEIIGGNLQTFKKLVGTEYFPKDKDPILVLEDVEPTLELTEALIKELRSTGFFDRCQGLIIGNFLQKDQSANKFYNEKITELLKSYNFPIIFTPNLGHGVGNEVIPIGGRISIDTTKKEYLFFKQ